MTNFWTPPRLDQLKELWKDGKSCSEIADIMGAKSRSAIIGKVRRLKLPYRKEPSIVREIVREKAPRPDRSIRPKFVTLSPELRSGRIAGPPARFIESAPYTCRYPVGATHDHGTADMMVCGDAGWPWCERHRKVVYSDRPLVKLNAGMAR